MNTNQYKVLQQAQGTLNNALASFLYGSVVGRFPMGVFEGSGVIKTYSLISCRSAFQAANIPVPISLQAISGKLISVRKYSSILADSYRGWVVAVNAVNHNKTIPGEKGTIPKGQAYGNWLKNGGDARRYKSVHRLRQLLKNEGAQFFLRGIAHGSIATLDDTPGFSDMDLAFIIKASALKDPNRLLGLRALAIHILILTFGFDPFMHHGPYYISEIDLGWYPEALFPSLLFHSGVDVLETAEELAINIRPSEDVTEKMIDMFQDFFRKWQLKPVLLKTTFELEWLLGSAMLLPALYLQYITKSFHYKRDTFSLARKDFTADEWEPIERASYLRAHLDSRPNPSSGILAIARALRWPGFLHIWGRCTRDSVNRAKIVSAQLGKDYPQKVLHLIDAMKFKMDKVSNAR